MARKTLWFTKTGDRALEEIIHSTGWDNTSGIVREALVLMKDKLKDTSDDGYELRRKIKTLKIAEEARG